MEQLISLIFLFVLLLFSAFFSGSETALFSLPMTKVNAYRSSSNAISLLIARLLEKPRDLLVTVFMLNTLVNILIQNVTSSISGPQASWVWKVLLPFILLLLLGEIIPKYIGIQKNVTIARFSAPIINFFQNLLSPIRKFIVAVTAPVSHAMFFYLRKEKDISHEELRLVLTKSQESGVLDQQEAELVWGYLSLQDASVKEVMRPRDEMLFYDIGEPLTKLQHLFIDQEVTRLPVCKGDIQNILGIITAQIYFLHQEELTHANLKTYLAKPEYVPETTPAMVLLRRLEKKKEEMALVIDEYGAITGLITYEDLVEVLIGEITDLRDKEELYVPSGKNVIIASGKMELTEFNKVFDVNLESPNNMVTIGGWLTEKLGTIPKSGLKCEFDGFFFHVLAAEPTFIRKLYIRKL